MQADTIEIIIPRKLSTPHNQENAFGAIMEDGSTFIDSRIVDALSISNDYIEIEKERQMQEMKEKS